MAPVLILAVYIGIFIVAWIAVHLWERRHERHDFTALKTVTFGDATAVRANRPASVISVLTIFLLWGMFTGSKLIPSFLHVPGPFVGETSFTYTLAAPDGRTDDAEVKVIVFRAVEGIPKKPKVDPGEGFAKNDVIVVAAARSKLVVMDRNDEITRKDGAKVVAINGQPVQPGSAIEVPGGVVTITDKGTINFTPRKGWQMEAIWLPPPEQVWNRFLELLDQGYQNYTLGEHLYWSLFRVVTGFLIGAVVGIPLGYAMGLSNWFRGWFDPIVEFMRPVPPLALIPLVIIWAGIGEEGKIILLFLAALWIMAIAARSGASGVKISKVHAAYSLGASKWQLMRYVIIPNSLPEIFTGARVAMGVCWGTVVAAELVAADRGAGMMIMVASRFQLTDIVLVGIILIGIIGYGIDIFMRLLERWLVPWKGKG
ncbi:MAG: ABC transporter permease subunit [Alphaproteobacteria bacterium]|nr:MAG: ABC transporter permease subunit [Alphaproteobacteria bacterium]